LNVPETAPASQGEPLESGTVKWFDSQKHYGVLTAPSGEEVWFHRDSIENADCGLPCERDAAFFRRQTTARGLSASIVRIDWSFGIIKTFRISWTLSPDDLRNAPSFAAKLRSAADAVSNYVLGRLRESTRLDLVHWQEASEVPFALKESLVEDLNGVIKGSSIWDEERFATADISQEVRGLLSGGPYGEALARVNRLLLEAAYPLDLPRTRPEQWDSTFAFGFIQQSPAGEDEVYFDIRDLRDSEPRKPVAGDYVAFSQVRRTDRGLSARNVNRVRPKFGIGKAWDRKRGEGSVGLEGSHETVQFSRDDLFEKRLDVGDAVSLMLCGSATTPSTRCVKKTLHLYRFAALGDEDEMLRQLEQKVLEGERWEYKSSRQSRRFPILWSYLFYTFERLQEEDRGTAEGDRKVTLSCTRDRAAFNTGLVDKMYRPIFAVFSKRLRHRPGEPLWEFQDFVCSGELVRGQSYMSKFAPLPERAQYFSNPKDVVFDTSLRLDAISEHIVGDRGFRLPKKLRDRIPPDMAAPEKIQAFLSDFLRLAIDRAIERVKWNYKTAVPQYYFEQSQLQLLLPLCIDDPRKVDLALAIERDEAAYVGRTILELDWAYSNARLIARPDSDWLTPDVHQREEEGW
jgi:cold shock CspA family protein